VKTHTLIRMAAGLAGAAALLAALIPGAAAAEVPSSQVPAGLKGAIKAAVEARGQTYAGFCRDIVQHEHHGEWCAFVLEIEGDEATVSYGAVASDELHLAKFVNGANGWSQASSDPHPGGPGEPQYSDVPSSQVPGDLKAAIKALIEGRGYDYAGFCRDIAQHEHVDKYCAFVLSLSASEAKVSFGRVLSDELTVVTLVKQGGAWVEQGSNGPSNPGTQVPSELREAIKRLVESKGQQYAGFCNEIDGNAHVGKYCAMVVSIDGSRAQVSIGRVLSDEIYSVTFVKSGNAWSEEGTSAPATPTQPNTPSTPNTPTPEPQEPGEVDGDGDDSGWPMLQMALGLAVAAGIGGTVVALRRR
jgi:hypothetical protein